MNGILNIDLKGTKVVVEEPQGWFKKLFTSSKEYEEESVTQLQYLEKIYKVFSELNWRNVVSLELNSEIIYEDKEYKSEDFQEAINLAYGKVQEKDFEVKIHLENDAEDQEEEIVIAFSSKHDVGEFPLNVEANLEKSSEEVKTFLTEVKIKISEVFGIESGEIEVNDIDGDEEDEEDEDEDEDEDESEDDEVEETNETKTETTEKKEEVAA